MREGTFALPRHEVTFSQSLSLTPIRSAFSSDSSTKSSDAACDSGNDRPVLVRVPLRRIVADASALCCRMGGGIETLLPLSNSLTRIQSRLSEQEQLLETSTPPRCLVSERR